MHLTESGNNGVSLKQHGGYSSTQSGPLLKDLILPGVSLAFPQSGLMHLGSSVEKEQCGGCSTTQSGPLLKDLISESIVKRMNILNKYWKQMLVCQNTLLKSCNLKYKRFYPGTPVHCSFP